MSSKYQIQIDGDTFHIVDGEGNIINRIRIKGIDTHESAPDANPSPLGELASKYIADSGGQAQIGDNPEYDVYGRQLGEYTDPNLANRAIRQGVGLSTSAENDQAFLDYIALGREKESDPILESTLQQMDWFRESRQISHSPYKKIDSGADPRGTTGERAWMRGNENLKASAYAFLQALNDVTGDDEASEDAKMKALFHAEKAGLIRKDIKSYKDVDSLSDAATYAYELLIEESPSLLLDAGLTFTGAGAGAVLGRRAAVTAARKRLGEEGFQKFAAEHPQLLDNMKNANGVSGAKKGAGAAYIAGTYPQEVAAVQQELNENNIEGEGATAFGMGALSTGVQVLPELALAGKLLKAADVDASDLAGIVNTGKEIAKNTATTAFAEGSAEAAATTIHKSAVALHDENYDVFSDKNKAEIMEAAVAGATLGGVLGGTSTTAAAGFRKADEIYREKREAQIAAQQQAQAQEAAAVPPAGDPTAGVKVEPPQNTEPTMVYGNAVDPKQDTVINDNFNPKLDSNPEHQMREFKPLVTEGADQATTETSPIVETTVAAEQSPTEAVVEQSPTEAVVEQSPTEAVVEQSPTEAVVEQSPTEAVVEQAPTEAVVEQASTETQAEKDEIAQLVDQLVAENQSAPTETVGQDEATQQQDEPELTAEEVARMRQNPAFIAASDAFSRSGRKLTLTTEDLNESEIQRLEAAEALIDDPLNPGTRIVHPLLMDNVVTYGAKGMTYSGPAPTTPKPREGESLAQGAQYGEGNPTPDGIYDRGTGRSVFLELANIAANEEQMRKSESGQTRATTKYRDMADSIDPLSAEFDAQLEELAQYVRVWGNKKADDVNMMLDRARLRTPNEAQSAPVLRQVLSKLREFQGVRPSGEAKERLYTALKYINQLSDSLAYAVKGFEKSSNPYDQLGDIIDVLENGGVKLTAKQQSVVHALASNSYVSASDLWVSDTGETSQVYDKQSDKVTQANAAPTTDKALIADADRIFMNQIDENTPKGELDQLNADIDTRIVALKNRLAERYIEYKNSTNPEDRLSIYRSTMAIRDKLVGLLARQEAVQRFINGGKPSKKRSKETTKAIKDLKSQISVLREGLNDAQKQAEKESAEQQDKRMRDTKAYNASVSQAQRIRDAALTKAGSDAKAIAAAHADYRAAVEAANSKYKTSPIKGLSSETSSFIKEIHSQLRRAYRLLAKLQASLRPEKSSTMSKNFARVAKQFNELGDDSAPLKEVLDMYHGVTPDAVIQHKYENEDGEASAQTIGYIEKHGVAMSSEITDFGGMSAKDFDRVASIAVKLSKDAEKVVNNFVRAHTGMELNEVSEIPLADRLHIFGSNYVSEIARYVSTDVEHRETANERRVRIASKLQTVISIVHAFKSNFEAEIFDTMLPDFLIRSAEQYNKNLAKFHRTNPNSTPAELEAFIKANPKKTQADLKDDPAYRDAVEDIERKLFMATLARVVGPDNPEYSEAYNISSARLEIKKLRAEIQNVRHDSDKEPLDATGGRLDLGDKLNKDIANLEEWTTLRDGKLRGPTSREMYDVSGTLLSAISNAVRHLIDARTTKMVLPADVRVAVRNGNYDALIDYAADNNYIPAMGNQLEQMVNNTVELAASNRTSMLTKYFVRKPTAGKSMGIIPINLIDPDGESTTVYFNLKRYFAEHLERVSPNMVNADMGARNGADIDDGVQDNSDPLENRATFDRIEHINNAYVNLLSDLSNPDGRLFGFRVSTDTINELLTDRSTLLLDDGPDSVTVGHLFDTLQTRATQARIADNFLATQDLTETKLEKAAAAKKLEEGLIQLFNIVRGDKLEVLARLVVRSQDKNQNSTAIGRLEVNIPRQIGALMRLVYGRNNSHLDVISGSDSAQYAFKIAVNRDDADSAKAMKDDLIDHYFTEPSLNDDDMAELQKLARKASLSAEKSKLSDVKDFTKTTELVDINYLTEIFDVMATHAETLGVEGAIDGETLRKEYDRLISAREQLALSFAERDYASIAEDKSRATDDIQIAEESKALSRQGTDIQDTSKIDERDANDPLLIAARRRARIHFANKAPESLRGVSERIYESEPTLTSHNDHIIPQIRAILGGSKAAQLVSNALTRMSNIAFGDPRFIDNIEFKDSGSREASIESDGVKIVVRLPFGHLDLNSPKGIEQFVKMAAHEFGHAVATIDTMSYEDAETVSEYYMKDIPVDEQAQYDVNEYIADLVAMKIMQNMVTDGIIRAERGEGTRIDSIISAVAKKITTLLKWLNSFGIRQTSDYRFTESPQLEFAEYLLNRRRARADKFEAVNAQGRLYYTERGTTSVMAKAKSKAVDLAKGGLDSALVKLFKPVAMRLQKIDRQLARMFFNPPGAKQEHGMGLMDMAVSSRTQLVHHFNRLYPKVDDFRNDYNKYLADGSATDALKGVFRRAAEMYNKVNPEFNYSGIPIMLNMDEITRRGGEFVQLLDHENAEQLLKSFDRSGGDATMNTDIKPANPFGRQELMDELIRNRPEIRNKLQQAGFFEPPTVAGLNKFFGGVAMRTEFERVFSDFEDVMPEFGLKFRTPNHKLKSRLDAIQDVNQRKEAIAMIGSMLGFDGSRIHPSWRAAQDWTISVVSAAILPLSGFASLPDPMMPFIRTRSWSEAVKGLFGVVRAYATDYKKTAELTRAFSLATNTIHDTVWSTVVINRDGNTIPEKISEVLFKYNGLQFLTNLSRNVSAVLAIDMVRRHSSGTTPYSRQFLAEMGISSDEAGRLIAYIDEHGTVPQYTVGNEAVNELHDIAQRVVTTFTNSSLIHPSKAQLPAIANDPNFRVLTLLKPFLYGFHSVIYGGGLRAGRDAIGKPRTLGEYLMNSPMGVMPLMLAFGIMMPLAAAGLMAREQFRDFLFGSNRVDKLSSMEDMEYLNKIFARAGGYGMAEYPMQIWEATQVDYRNPLVTALGPVASTFNQTGGDIVKAVSGEGDSIRFGYFEIPVPVE